MVLARGEIMRSKLPVAAVVATALFTSSTVGAAEAAEAEAPRADYLFPGGGNVGASIATGAPFAAIGEISVGVGDRFAAGALVGAGPFSGGVVAGVRPRVDALHLGPMRLVLEAPVLWYPGLNGADNWMLAKPQARFEGTAGAFRAHASIGVLGAKMIGGERDGRPIRPYGGTGAGLPSGVQEGMFWNTFGAGAALALSARTALFLDASVLMNGLSVAGPEWFRVPFAVALGVSTVL
jgi:hypothetical protein